MNQSEQIKYKFLDKTIMVDIYNFKNSYFITFFDEINNTIVTETVNQKKISKVKILQILDNYYHQIKKDLKHNFKKKNKLVKDWVLNEYLQIVDIQYNHSKIIDESSKNMPAWVINDYLQKNIN